MKQLWTNFRICSQPSRNLRISLQDLHTMLLKVSSSLRKPTSGFLDIGKRVVFKLVHFTHTFGRITLTQVDIFLRELDTFQITFIRALKSELIPVNTSRKVIPENIHFLIPWSKVTKRRYNYLHIFNLVRM